MNKMKKMFVMQWSQKELRRGKRILASIMLPILVFQMTSMNFLAMELMTANAAGEVVVAEEAPKVEAPKEEAPKEEVKEESKEDEALTSEETATPEATPEPEEDSTESEDEVVVETPIVETALAEDVSEEVKSEEEIKAEAPVEKKAEWVVDGNTASIEPVVLNETYKAPQNNKVTVKFTKLPEKAGSLVIKEIKLSEEEMLSLGALSDTAYDITSNMENGTFEYDLTLPYPDKDNDGKAEVDGNSKNEVKADNLTVLYTEGDTLEKDEMMDVKEDDSVDKNTNKAKKVLELKGLDHFTVFVVTNSNPIANGDQSNDFCATKSAGGVFQCYDTLSAAIAAASEDAVIIIKAGSYTEDPIVNKDLTLELNGDVTFNGAFTVSGTGSDLILKSHGHTLTANTITNGGVIKNVTGDGNIILVATTGNITARHITSVGDVSLTATLGNILDDPSGAQATYITGTNINLSAPAGSIGTYVASPTTIGHFDGAVDVALGTGTLNATALNDVAVTEVVGTDIDSSDYNLVSGTAGNYVIFGNMKVGGAMTVDSAFDSDAFIRLVSDGAMVIDSVQSTSASNLELYSKGNITLNKSLTAGTNTVVSAGFSSGLGSIIDDGSQDTTINAANITLNANGGTVSGIVSVGDGTIDFMDAVDVALGGGTLTTNGGYVTETGGARNGTYILNGGNLSLSKAFSGSSALTSDNGKLTITDDDTNANILIGEYSGSVAGGLSGATPFGTYYEVQKEGSLTDDINLELKYTQADLDAVGITENQISDLFYNNVSWQGYAGTVDRAYDNDPYIGRILVLTDHLTPMVAGADTTSPTVSSVVWSDVDDSTDISPTDTVAVTFSEPMDASTIDTINVDARLGFGHTFGTTGNGMNAVWSASDTILTVTLGTDSTVVTGDTIDPTADVKDDYGNSDATSSPVAILDTVSPEVDDISTTATDPTKNSPIPVVIEFSENVTGLSADDFTVTNGIAGNLTGSGADYTFDVTPTTNGTVSVTLSATKVSDAASNGNLIAGMILSLVYDNTNPTVTVDTLSTGDTTPFLTGTYSDASAVVNINVTVDGHVYVATVDYGGAGTWGASVTNALTDGNYNVSVMATDAATNVGNDVTTNELSINTTAPNLVKFYSSTADGLYGIGSVIDITAEYDETVDTGSYLTVTLNTGDSIDLDVLDDKKISGSYTVGAGDGTNDLTITAITYEDVNDLFSNNRGDSDITDINIAEQNLGYNADLVIDGVAPTVALTYSENPANVGAMTVTATYSEAVASTPNISIDQQGSTDITTVAMTPGAAGVYTYDYTVVADNGVTYKDGTATVSLSSVNDAAGNTAGAPTGTTFVIDTTAPTVTSTTIASNNADTTQAKVGDVVTLTFVSSEGVQTPTVTIAENGATVTQGIDNQHWTATYTMLSGDVAGVVAFNIAFTDLAGNVGTSVTATSDTSSVTFDKIAPGPTAVTIDSDSDGDTDTDYAKVGDTVTLVFTSDENIKNPTVTILGHDATEAGAGTSWTATYVVQSGDTEGTVTFAIDYSDLAGNAGAQVSTVTNSSSVVFDETDPDAPDYRTNEGQWFKSNPTLDIDFSDDVELEKVEYKLNSGGSWRDIETDINDNNYNDNWSMSSGDWDSMNDGSNYYLYFRITDKAGNVYETDDNGEAFYLRKDNDDPSAPTYVTAEDQTFFSNPVLDIDFSDSWTLDKVKYQLDGVGGTWTTLATGLSGKTYTTNWSMTTGIWDNLATGTHYIYFQITDDAGNDYETGSNGAGFLFYKNSGSGGTIAGVESNGAVDGGEGAVQGDQAPAGDQGVLGDGANKDGAVAPVGDTPWYRTLPFEVAAVIVLIGSTIWWWIRRRGSSGGVGILGSFMFTTLKTAASRVRMFFW